MFVFKTSGDGNSYLGDDGKYHSLTYLSDFVEKVEKLEQKLNNGELKGDKGDQGDRLEGNFLISYINYCFFTCR